MIKKILLFLLEPLMNEDGKGGGADVVQTTEYPDPTPEEIEANKALMQLTDLQTQEMKRRADLTSSLAPEREKILRSQLELGKQAMTLSGKAKAGLSETLNETDLQKQRGDLQAELLKQQMGKLTGEIPAISPQQKMRLDELEQNYTGAVKQDLSSLQDAMRSSGMAENERMGLLPGANAFSQSEEELGRQVDQAGRTARITNLGQQLDLPMQNLGALQMQREFAEKLGQQDEVNRLNSMLSLYSGAGSGGGIPSPTQGANMQDSPYSITPAIQQAMQGLQAGREAMASTSSYTPKDRTAGAVSGGISGLTTGAGVGALIGSGITAATVAPAAAVAPVLAGAPTVAGSAAAGAAAGSSMLLPGAIIGAGIGALAGIIYGYNA